VRDQRKEIEDQTHLDQAVQDQAGDEVILPQVEAVIVVAVTAIAGLDENINVEDITHPQVPYQYQATQVKN
jgi:hypothetical protein